MADAARKLAAECLLRCEAGGYSNLVLRQMLGKSELPRRDRAFCTALVLGTLSRVRTLDALLQPYLKKPVARLDGEVRVLLRMGAYQLKYMRGVPQHAAVNESVQLCRALKKSSAAGMVNAVLRRTAEADAEAVLAAIKDPVQRLAVSCSVEDALAAQFLSLYGERAEAVLQSFFAPAAIYARCNTLKCSEDALCAALQGANITAEQTALPGCLRLAEGFSGACAPLADGRMRIQSLPAQLAAFAVGARAGERVLDLCSAPGGKTLCLAQDMENRGHITACELHEHRLKLVLQQAALEGVDIITGVCGDAAQFQSDTLFDRVLCDVPCSGYGELASKPELRYRPPSFSAELPALQYAILENGARLLKAGGTLVYSTCTL
ncbi:MAG: 16S rRNA (cytosine(967)-C(5))-methyltransferase RsmB, partial [Oscillospiraceae bacterium]|nr:16S rRNA (cytosine(967)-C(5))-methyltransferase RsmB [Oscillospiraceae bacterium]